MQSDVCQEYKKLTGWCISPKYTSVAAWLQIHEYRCLPSNNVYTIKRVPGRLACPPPGGASEGDKEVQDRINRAAESVHGGDRPVRQLVREDNREQRELGDSKEEIAIPVVRRSTGSAMIRWTEESGPGAVETRAASRAI